MISRKLSVILAAVLAMLLLLLAGLAAALLATGGEYEASGGAASTSERGYLGLTVTLVAGSGLRVTTIEAGGPADSAGVRVGDILRSVDGRIVRTPEQLRAAIESHKPGERVTLTLERGDSELQARVRLAGAPAGAVVESTPTLPQGAQPGQAAQQPGRLGVSVQQITPQLQQRFNLQRDSGVVVTQVAPGSAAARAGLQPADIVLFIEGTTISSVEQLQRLVLSLPSNQAIEIGIQRGTQQLSVRAALPPQASVQDLENILPRELRESLQRQVENGTMPPEQLQQVVRLYLARGDNVRVGVVTSITEGAITLRPSGSSQEVTVAITPRTALRRGAATIRPEDIQAGETVLVLSMDGGSTAFQVSAFGFVP